MNIEKNLILVGCISFYLILLCTILSIIKNVTNRRSISQTKLYHWFLYVKRNKLTSFSPEKFHVFDSWHFSYSDRVNQITVSRFQFYYYRRKQDEIVSLTMNIFIFKSIVCVAEFLNRYRVERKRVWILRIVVEFAELPASKCRNSKSIRVAYGIVKEPWLHEKTCSRSSACSTLLSDEPQRMETTYCYSYNRYTIFLSTLVSEFIFARECVSSVCNDEELLVQKTTSSRIPFSCIMKGKKHDFYFWKPMILKINNFVSNIIIIVHLHDLSGKLFHRRLKINLNYVVIQEDLFVCAQT